VLTAKGPGGSKEATARVTVTVPSPPIANVGPGNEQLFSQNMKDVFFAYDKYSVPENEQTAVEQDARFLAAHPKYKLLISGHCDERGSEDYNLALGDNRADAVRDQLERLGISADRIRTISYGKEKPFCAEDTEACWQLNRRAHFSMQR
jgi:peptidoglycan-associated lipoprotein